MLDNFDTSKPERFAQGDAYDQVAAICTHARPKIQKWINDAQADDPESLDTFLSINDLINNVLDRYERYRKGDYSSPPEAQPSAANDLIDFDGDQSRTSRGPKSDAAELEELFGGLPSPPPTTNPAQAPRQAISLGSPSPAPQTSSSPPSSFPQFTNTITPAQSQSLWNNSALMNGGGSVMQPTSSSAPPAFGALGHVGSTGNVRLPLGGTGSPGLPMNVSPASSAPATQSASSAAPTKKDPFADLEGLF